MKILTSTNDKKISAVNHLIEMRLGDYADISKDILKNNELQRKRIKTSNRSYVLLKDDLKKGCVIPPIVLAIFPNEKENIDKFNANNLIEKIVTAGSELLILDGLQRTYTINDTLSEISNDPKLLEDVKNLPLRIEVYTGISKIGVLYRMLTLNTGQNPMSTRHQIEMLYSDYKHGFPGLVFITEADEKIPSGDNEFRFNDILDGFISYITGDYLPLEREDLIKMIKNLEILTKDDKQKDLFKQLITCYNNFRVKINKLASSWTYDNQLDIKRKAFGKNVNEIFSKVQVIAGFGSALNFLIENELIENLEEVNLLSNKISGDNIDCKFQ